MTTALLIAALCGSFALARWYGFGIAATALGLVWAPFAWFPVPPLPTALLACLVIGGMILVGVLRERRRQIR